MQAKWLAGGVVAICALGFGVVGAVTVQRHAPRPAQDSAMPGYARDYVSACRSAVRERNASRICKCMVDSFEGLLRTEDEYRLAGAITAAIVRSGPNQAVMQANFNRVSQEFYGRVSIERKAAVLRIVSTEGVACGKANR